MAYLSPTNYAKHWDVSYSLVMHSIHNGRLKAEQIGEHTYRINANEKIQPKAVSKTNGTNFLKRLKEV